MKYYRLMPVEEFQIEKRLGGNRFLGTTADVRNIQGYLTNQAIFKLIVIGIEEYYLLEEWITGE